MVRCIDCKNHRRTWYGTHTCTRRARKIICNSIVTGKPIYEGAEVCSRARKYSCDTLAKPAIFFEPSWKGRLIIWLTEKAGGDYYET